MFIKQQLAAVYHDFTIRSTAWEHKEKNFKEEAVLLKNDSDDCKLSLRRTEEILEASGDAGVAAEQFVKLGRQFISLVFYVYLLLFL